MSDHIWKKVRLWYEKHPALVGKGDVGCEDFMNKWFRCALADDKYTDKKYLLHSDPTKMEHPIE